MNLQRQTVFLRLGLKKEKGPRVRGEGTFFKEREGDR